MKRETRRVPLTYRGATLEVDQPGDWCPACGEGVLSAADMAATDKARHDLIARTEGLRLSHFSHRSGHDRHAKRGPTPVPMTKPKSKRKPEDLAKLLKAVRKDNTHPAFGLDKSVYYARLKPPQVKELKRLARERGTTVAQELENAIEAYGAGLSRREIRLVNTVLDGLNESFGRNSRPCGWRCKSA